MRIRTYKSKGFFYISNETAQDKNLSFEALGFLSYALSMPEDWEFKPKIVWKERKNLSRNKTYALFNELIETYHCIRIKLKNKDYCKIWGETLYEIFDDVDECKKRIVELENDDATVIHAGNLKKFLRDPGFEDTYNDHIYKETSNTKITLDKETTTHREFSKEVENPKKISSSFSKRKLEELEKLNFSPDKNQKFYSAFTDEQILQGIEYTLNISAPISNMAGYLWNAIKNGYKRQKTPKEIDLENRIKAESLKNENKTLADDLFKKYHNNMNSSFSFKVRENLIELKENKGYVMLDLSNPKCFAQLEEYINRKNIQIESQELAEVMEKKLSVAPILQNLVSCYDNNSKLRSIHR